MCAPTESHRDGALGQDVGAGEEPVIPGALPARGEPAHHDRRARLLVELGQEAVGGEGERVGEHEDRPDVAGRRVGDGVGPAEHAHALGHGARDQAERDDPRPGQVSRPDRERRALLDLLPLGDDGLAHGADQVVRRQLGVDRRQEVLGVLAQRRRREDHRERGRRAAEPAARARTRLARGLRRVGGAREARSEAGGGGRHPVDSGGPRPGSPWLALDRLHGVEQGARLEGPVGGHQQLARAARQHVGDVDRGAPHQHGDVELGEQVRQHVRLRLVAREGDLHPAHRLGARGPLAAPEDAHAGINTRVRWPASAAGGRRARSGTA